MRRFVLAPDFRVPGAHVVHQFEVPYAWLELEQDAFVFGVVHGALKVVASEGAQPSFLVPSLPHKHAGVS